MRKLLLLLACVMLLTTLPVFGQLIDESFESSSFPAGWTTETNSGNTWSVYSTTGACDGSYVARYNYNSSQAADSWFFSPGVSLTAGTTYVLEFQYRSSGLSSYPENLRVRYGTAQGSGGMSVTLIDIPGIATSTCQQAQVSFSPASSGTYYFGWQCYSAANQYYLYVDDILLYEAVPVSITPDPIIGSKCTTVPMNVANASGTSQSFSFSQTAPGSLAVSFSPVNPSIADGSDQDVDVIVTPVTAPDWSLISFAVTATGDNTADSDIATFNAYPNWWEALADCSSPDYDVAAVAVNGDIYKFNGYSFSYGDHAELYDIDTDTWSALSDNPYHSYPSPVSAVHVDGNIYLMNSGYGDPGNMYRYHIATDTYYQIPLPDGLDYLGSGEMVYYCGNLWIMGADGIYDADNIYFYKYHIATGTWTLIADQTTTPLGYLRIAQGMVQKNGKIYILGGLFDDGTGPYTWAVVVEYDIATDTWSIASLPILPGLGYYNKAWIVGSYIFVDDGSVGTSMWVFKLNDPSWTDWEAIAAMPIDQYRYGAAYWNGVLYAVNGYNDRDALQAMSFCPLVANAGAGMCVCPDYNGTVDLGPADGSPAVGGAGGYTYAWSDGLGWTSTSESPTYTVNPANLPITITLTVTDGMMAVDTDTMIIASYPPLVADAGPNGAGGPGAVYTLGGTPTGTGPVGMGGNIPYNYSWTCAEDAGWSSTLEHPTYTLGAGGSSYTFTVEVTDACGTVATDSVTIVSGDLQVNPGANRAICIGDSTVLGGSPTAYDGVPPYTYSWTSDPAGFTSSNPNPTVSPTVSTRYTVTVTDALNPAGLSGTVQVDVVPYLAAPSMLVPSNGANLSGLNVGFSWTDVANETGYKLHLADSLGHHWTFTTAANVTDLVIDGSFGVLSRDVCYTWWVQATSDGTYCDSQQTGTYAFCIDDVPPVPYTLIFASDQVTKGDLSNTRTNLGMISLRSAYVNAHLTLRNKNGTVLSSLELPVGYNQYAAYVDLLDYFPAPYNEGSIDMWSTDYIYTIGGLVDNVTNDPSIYPQDIERGEHIMTPIVLRTDDWKTQVVLRNLAEEDLDVTMTTYISSSSPTMVKGASVSTVKTVTIPGQGYFKTDDIMAYMMDPHVYALLTAEVTGGSGHITGFARQLTSDNMGGIYPFYTVGGGYTAYVFPYVVDDTARRSNIGLANTNANTISVTVSFVHDGYVAGTKSYDVEGNGYLPIANVIRDITGTTGIQHVEGYLTLNSASPFRVVGGPIDNVSNDPSVFGGYNNSFYGGFTPLVLRSGPWTSRLVLANIGASNVTVDLVLYQSGEAVGTITRTVYDNDILVIDDIIGEFTTEDLYGSLFIYASGPIYGFVEQTTGPGGASGVYPVFELP